MAISEPSLQPMNSDTPRSPMPDSKRQFPALVTLVGDLETAGYESVLVGGMALVTMGSQRLTRDFDLMISDPDPTREQLVRVMYRRGLELVTKFSPAGEVLRTVDSVDLAITKIKMKTLRSMPFFDWTTMLRVDLLIDFPVSAREVREHAIRVTVEGGTIHVASREDLIRLKEMAQRDRTSAGDAQDLEFLRRITPG